MVHDRQARQELLTAHGLTGGLGALLLQQSPASCCNPLASFLSWLLLTGSWQVLANASGDGGTHCIIHSRGCPSRVT
jgi:hypothetical protein